MLKAILFDCDGVISETEISRFRYLKKLAEEKGHYGVDEKEHLKHIIGKRSEEFLRNVFGGKISEREVEEITDRRHKDWEKTPEKFITPMKEVKQVCKKFAKKYDLAVASTAPRQTVEATIRHLGLKKYFKLVLTGDDIKKPKPSSEIYLEALKRLNLKSDQCIAIEDSETGIAAAREAGIKVVALRNKLYEEYGYKPDLSDADIAIDDLSELLKVVKIEEGK